MRYQLAALVLLLAACGPKPFASVDGDLQPYFNSFRDISGGRDISDVEGKFYYEESKILGTCSSTMDHKVISINMKYWPNLGEKSRLSLIYHEFGHCTLGRDHRDDMLSDGCPLSMMNTYAPAAICLDRHWDDYTRELLSNR